MLKVLWMATISLVVLTVAVLFAPKVAARGPDTEEDLVAHIQHEQDPVKKAKYEIRLGQVKLQQAADAYHLGEIDRGPKLLDAYLECMQESWKLLKGSGRDATRKPSGFKELEFSLREDARQLEDLRRHVSYLDRDPLDRVVQETDKAHNEVMNALFPQGQPAR
jgi:hypothetical protein